jgi:PAS domain S-box-containing protein
VVVLLGSLFFLEILLARELGTMTSISELKDFMNGIYLKHFLLRGLLGAAVVLVLFFVVAKERARFRALKKETKVTTTNLARYARRLKRSEEKHRSLVELADDVIYTADKYGNILSINRCFSGLIGASPAEVIGKNIGEVFRYNTSTDIMSIFEKVLEQCETVAREEKVEIGSSSYWLHTKYQAVGCDADVAPLVLVISRDITEHKIMQEKIFQTEKLASLGALSAGVAHEINNPIAVILGFVELLLDKIPEGLGERKIYEAIQRQGNNCKRVVENLLAFARIPEETTSETDLVEDLEKAVDLVANTLVTEKVDLQRRIERDLPKVKGDGPQLQQAFINIINNAIYAMKGGGTLTVSAFHGDDGVCVAFSDTGEGIPPENRNKVFEPFFTTKEVGEGTGLGLSVSYGIVKTLGGDIAVSSQTREEGQQPGTTFTVILPLAQRGEIGTKEEGDEGSG